MTTKERDNKQVSEKQSSHKDLAMTDNQASDLKGGIYVTKTVRFKAGKDPLQTTNS